MRLAKIFAVFFAINNLFAQNIPFNYQIKTKAVTIPNLNGLHSFVSAQANGKWLIIGGRKDGLHARQPFNAFPLSNNNTNIFVIDINSQQFWSSSLSTLSTSLQEQLQSTNMNFYQDEDTLYIIGAYGYSNTSADHITYPNLTSVSVSGLINAVVSSNSITPYFKQITDQNFAVTGGQLGKIGDTYYLIGGHRFDGRYNPMGNATYIQTYVDGIKKFKLNNSGTQLTYSNYTTITDQIHLHRRDYNLMPQIFPNGEEGYMISSGVFQVGVDLPFLYPVDIKASGHTPNTTFYQHLSNYHSAKLALYDSVTKSMHSIFLGGMSQFYYLNNVLMQDDNVPFVKTISRVSRDSMGNLQEYAFNNEMPALVGASAEFILNHNTPHYKSEIIKLSQLSSDSVLVGHIYGGIYSPNANPFTNNNTGVTSPSSVIYEVWLVKDFNTGIKTINGKNRLSIQLFPNPVKYKLEANVEIPYNGKLNLYITDTVGEIVAETELGEFQKGIQTIKLSDKIKLKAGTYLFNFVFDGRYSKVEKIVIEN